MTQSNPPKGPGHTGGREGESGGAGRRRGGQEPRTVGGRATVLRAIAVFILLMGAYYVVEYCFLLDGKILESYLSLIASATGTILNLFGLDVIAQGKWILLQPEEGTTRSFGVEIVHGCDALEPTVAYLAALLASPVAFRRKIPGILIGVPVLLVVNMVRIVSLFLVGVYYRKALNVMHYDVWQAAFIVLAIVAWAIWVQWATREKAVQHHVPH